MASNILSYLNPFKSADFSQPQNKGKTNSGSYKDDPAGFMVSIIKAQHSEYKIEINNWLSAREEALNILRPRRQPWIEMCDKIMTDATVLAEVNKRIDRVLNKEFKITEFSNKKENPDKTDLFNKEWFYDWQRFELESIFYGHSLPYIKKIQDGLITEVDIVDRKHIIPELHSFLPDLNGVQLIDYTVPPFSQYSTPVGKNWKLGLFDAIAPLYILKKHSWANWDQFEEMFGVPIRIAKTASTDPKVKAAITAWLKDMGSANFGLFPKDAEMEIIESKQTDAFKVFNEKRKAANEEICTLINSQAEGSSDKGSRAKTESMITNTQDETTKADLRFIYFQVNDKLMFVLQGIGYPIDAVSDIFQWNIPDNLQEKLTVFKGVNDMGFELDPTQVEEVFNVKILGKKETSSPSGDGGTKKQKTAQT